MVAHIYKNKAGSRLPSVTTVISRFKESGGLIHWAWNLGIEGKDYRQERDAAATAGTIAHQMVEARLRGEDYTPPTVDVETLGKANGGFEAYLTWERMTKVSIVHSEVSLVSENYGYGGTLDAIGEFEGKRVLIDWKTSNSVYQDYLIQLAAYKTLWEENYPDHPIDGGFHLCRFGKEHGDFAHHYYPDLSDAWEQFQLYRRAYDLDKALKKRAA